MTWALLLLLALAPALAAALVAQRRAALVREQQVGLERRRAVERGSDRARLQIPFVDLSACIGCATCVRACPEEGVLGILHGQARVLHGARCVGHGRCAEACPVGAIAVRVADVAERRDLPALTDELEAVGRPGLFLAGEVTGHALVRTAIEHGSSVARAVARREPTKANVDHDLVIVGAGPAGLACSLEAKNLGLRAVVLEQDSLGGTVRHYPRRKLVLTQPVELPLVGRLPHPEVLKEELVETWERAEQEHGLDIRTGVRLESLERVGVNGSSAWSVRTSAGELRASHVCLALGRRGTPRRLGVPGEELPKVLYALLDAATHRGVRVLVVGGGDSAVEAALGLAEQPGNVVHLSYRRAHFTRLKARNEQRIEQAVAEGRIHALLGSDVAGILPDHVAIRRRVGDVETTELLPNDEVFVLIGGEPPFPILEAAGVSLDPADRPATPELVEQGPGLVRALAGASLVAFAALAWAVVHRDYYGAPIAERLASPRHDVLAPHVGVGLALGGAAVLLFLANLTYLARRASWFPLNLGSLRSWMTVHILTGTLALVAASVHAGLRLGDGVGGHALGAMAVLVASGAVGRYLYSFVPRAANGRELALEEIEGRLSKLSQEWDRLDSPLVRELRDELAAGTRAAWSGGLVGRLRGALVGRARRRELLRRTRARAVAADLDPALVRELESLVRRVHRTSTAVAHLEDLRGLLATWRYVHRWVALLLALLVGLHVWTAVRWGELAP